jgi:wyosine [tRNA(Phe)-imidazoG37] synthetase (radical SAM superfamily)
MERNKKKQPNAKRDDLRIVYGPVPSRRLGRSLGINNIPPKICSYSCAYCQIGRTGMKVIERQSLYQPERIFADVHKKLERVQGIGEPVDYLTFVADGEPTLDANLAKEIALLQPLGHRIAVITNSSLLWRQDVRSDLKQADWISVKVDAVREKVWRKLDRPHPAIKLRSVLDGVRAFAGSYQGKLVTETMLCKDVNDDPSHVEELADFIAELNPSVAYLAVPTRPPAEKWIVPSDERTVHRASTVFRASLVTVECLVGSEEGSFPLTGDAVEDLLAVTSVHPMREETVKSFLAEANMGWTVIEGLLREGRLVEKQFRGKRFYLRPGEPKIPK